MKEKQFQKGNWKGPQPSEGGFASSSTELSFSQLISAYASIQSQVASDITQIASKLSVANPGQFLYLQFAMSKVSQIGDTLSNMVSLVNNTIATMVRNQK